MRRLTIRQQLGEDVYGHMHLVNRRVREWRASGRGDRLSLLTGHSLATMADRHGNRKNVLGRLARTLEHTEGILTCAPEKRWGGALPLIENGWRLAEQRLRLLAEGDPSGLMKPRRKSDSNSHAGARAEAE